MSNEDLAHLSREERAARQRVNREAQGPQPDIGDINAHLYALFPPERTQAYPDSWFEISFGLSMSENFSVFDLQKAATFAEQKSKQQYNIYVGPALRHGARPTGTGRSNRSHTLTAFYVWADFDKGGDDERIAAVLTRHNLKPAMVITTGTVPHLRRHLYFRLKAPASPEQIEAANVALIKLLGSDKNVKDPSRLMRLAGAISRPSRDKRSRGYITEIATFHEVQDAATYDVEDIIRLAPTAKTKSNGKDHSGAHYHSAGASHDVQKVASALSAIKNDLDRDAYLKIGYAVYAAIGEDGCDLFKAWARQWSGFDNDAEANLERDWESFKDVRDINPETLWFFASQRGWRWKDERRGEWFQTNGSAPEAPHPLIRPLPPADPFPVDALGPILGPAAMAIHDLIQAPLAICGQSVLAAAALCVQGYSNIDLPKQPGRPISSFFVSVAASGERKTAVDGEALRPIRKRVKELREDYEAQLPQFKDAMTAWEKARDEAKKQGNGNYATIAAALTAVGPEPLKPLLPWLTCSEPTFEGLYKLLSEGQPSIGIFSDEGGAFIGGHGMNDEAIKRTATGLSNLWNATDVTRTRGGDGATSLSGRRLSVHLMAQPDIAAEMLSNPVLLDQGFLSRFLVTAPESGAGSREWREADPSSEPTIRRYEEALLRILRRPLPLVAGKRNELEPPALQLTSEARALWVGFYNWSNTGSKAGGELVPVLSLANKIPEHAGRLAAVLTLVQDIEAREIGEEEMAAGITLAQHTSPKRCGCSRWVKPTVTYW
jgi:hypothetical protein